MKQSVCTGTLFLCASNTVLVPTDWRTSSLICTAYRYPSATLMWSVSVHRLFHLSSSMELMTNSLNSSGMYYQSAVFSRLQRDCPLLKCFKRVHLHYAPKSPKPHSPSTFIPLETFRPDRSFSIQCLKREDGSACTHLEILKKNVLS